MSGIKKASKTNFPVLVQLSRIPKYSLYVNFTEPNVQTCAHLKNDFSLK